MAPFLLRNFRVLVESVGLMSSSSVEKVHHSFGNVVLVEKCGALFGASPFPRRKKPNKRRNPGD